MRSCFAFGVFGLLVVTASVRMGYAQSGVAQAGHHDSAAAVAAGYLDESNRLLPPGGPRWLPTPKRVRVYFEGQLIADSRNVRLLRETTVPAYYFPESDVKTSLFVPSTLVKRSAIRGDASYWSIKVGNRVAEDAAWTYRTPVAGAEFLKGYVAFDWAK